MSGVDQYRNGSRRITRALSAHQGRDLCRLLILTARVHHHFTVPLNARRNGRQVAYRGQARIVGGWEDRAAMMIHPIDELRRRAEIAAQLQRRELQAADALIACAQEQADLGLAKLIDRLHRIAHGKQGATVAGFPPDGERAQQLELIERCVLKFIDENVPNRIAAAQRQIGGLTPLGQTGARSAGHSGKVDSALGGKFHLQFGRRVTQQQ